MPRCPICEKKATRFFVTIKDYTYCHCTRCKALFLNPPPPQLQMNKYYQENFTYDEGIDNETAIRNRAKVILKHLFHLKPKGKTLLDIGSGYGFFLDEAQKINLELTGIESSKNLFLNSANKTGIIKNMSFETFYQSRLKKRFDFITVTHVIEHTSQPRLWIKSLSSLLNPGGILYIETPNLDSHLFYAEKYFYTFLTPPNHVFLFSKRCFFKMIRHVRSLRILSIKTHSYPEHFMGIIKGIIKGKGMGVEKKGPPQRAARHYLIGRASTGGDMNSRQDPSQASFLKNIKFLIFDKIIATLFYRFLNLYDKGSILELYIKKI